MRIYIYIYIYTYTHSQDRQTATTAAVATNPWRSSFRSANTNSHYYSYSQY